MNITPEKSIQLKRSSKFSQLSSMSICRRFQTNLHETSEIFPSINKLFLKEMRIQDNLNGLVNFKKLQFLEIRGLNHDDLDLVDVLSKLAGLEHQFKGLKFIWFNIRNIEFLRKIQKFINLQKFELMHCYDDEIDNFLPNNFENIVFPQKVEVLRLGNFEFTPFVINAFKPTNLILEMDNISFQHKTFQFTSLEGLKEIRHLNLWVNSQTKCKSEIRKIKNMIKHFTKSKNLKSIDFTFTNHYSSLKKNASNLLSKMDFPPNIKVKVDISYL